MPKNLQYLPIVNQKDLYSQDLDDFILVDVRETEEREINKIDIKAQCHVPLGEIKYFDLGSLANLNKDQRLICYCNSGRRSLIAAMFLRTAGFTNVNSLSGGIQSWEP